MRTYERAKLAEKVNKHKPEIKREKKKKKATGKNVNID